MRIIGREFVELYKGCPYCHDEEHAPIILVCLKKGSDEVYAVQSCSGCVHRRASRLRNGGIMDPHVMEVEEYLRWRAVLAVMDS